MKKLASLVLILVLVAPAAFSFTTADFDGALNGFLTEVTDALPDSAVVGGTWSDAYIGQLIGVPPHFGIGVAAGITRFPVAELGKAVAMTGMELPVDTLFLPNAAIEARIGGFILPFDAGIRFGMIPSIDIPGTDISLQYFNIGADVRYALIKGGLVKPDLSIGLGYTYTSGEIGYGFDAMALAGFGSYGSAPGTLATSFSTSVIETKLQISKSLLVITPYAGAGLFMAMSKADYTVKTAAASTTDSVEDTGFGARVFGGLSFNMLILKLDVTGMYNVMSKNWGVNLGTRIQL